MWVSDMTVLFENNCRVPLYTPKVAFDGIVKVSSTKPWPYKLPRLVLLRLIMEAAVPTRCNVPLINGRLATMVITCEKLTPKGIVYGNGGVGT